MTLGLPYLPSAPRRGADPIETQASDSCARWICYYAASSKERSSSAHIAIRGLLSEGVMVPLNMPVLLSGIATEESHISDAIRVLSPKSECTHNYRPDQQRSCLRCLLVLPKPRPHPCSPCVQSRRDISCERLHHTLHSCEGNSLHRPCQRWPLQLQNGEIC